MSKNSFQKGNSGENNEDFNNSSSKIDEKNNNQIMESDDNDNSNDTTASKANNNNNNISTQAAIKKMMNKKKYQNPIVHWPAQSFKTVGLSPEKIKQIIDSNNISNSNNGSDKKSDGEGGIKTSSSSSSSSIDENDIVEQIKVHKRQPKTTVVKTYRKVSINQLKQQFFSENDDDVVIMLNTNSKVHNTQESPEKNYIPYEQYRLQKENDQLRRELELAKQSLVHMSQLLQQQSDNHKNFVELTNENKLLQNDKMQLLQQLAESKMSEQTTMFNLKEAKRQIEDYETKVRDLQENGSHKQVISKLQQVCNLKKQYKHNKHSLLKYYRNDFIAQELVTACYELFGDSNSNSSNGNNSGSGYSPCSTPSSYKKVKKFQQQQQPNIIGEGKFKDICEEINNNNCEKVKDDADNNCGNNGSPSSSSSTMDSSSSAIALTKRRLEYNNYC